jgi:hypothetical protein
MTIVTRLEQWKDSGATSGVQYDALAAMARRDRFSLFVELNTLLYLGVLALAGGISWTMTTYSARLGDAAILSSLTGVFCWSFYYCFAGALPYSHREVEHPGLAFDYVLYLGCLVFALDLGYLQSRFHPFQLDWDHSLLVASAVFLALAYRFDNRLVLSLALSSLAAWWGVRLSHDGLLLGGSLRAYALAYGGFVAGTGTALHRAGIKRHFLETYLHVAANVLFIALLSGVEGMPGDWFLYLMALLGLAGVAIVAGVQFKRFAFVVYGVVYGYLAISIRALRDIHSVTSSLAYFVVSGTIVILALVALARRFGREA